MADRVAGGPDDKGGRVMYVFAVAALLGLGVLFVAMLAERYPPMRDARQLWAVLILALGIGAAWIANFDIWRLWALPVRWAWVGTTLTGVMLAGLAAVWHELLGLFTGLGRKYQDEAAKIEKAEGLRPVA
jgi:hypothetical protein